MPSQGLLLFLNLSLHPHRLEMVAAAIVVVIEDAADAVVILVDHVRSQRRHLHLLHQRLSVIRQQRHINLRQRPLVEVTSAIEASVAVIEGAVQVRTLWEARNDTVTVGLFLSHKILLQNHIREIIFHWQTFNKFIKFSTFTVHMHVLYMAYASVAVTKTVTVKIIIRIFHSITKY